MRGLGLALLVSLAGCQSEPDFDERYDAVAEDIRKTAQEIDKELEDRSETSREAEDAAQSSGDKAAS